MNGSFFFLEEYVHVFTLRVDVMTGQGRFNPQLWNVMQLSSVCVVRILLMLLPYIKAVVRENMTGKTA